MHLSCAIYLDKPIPRCKNKKHNIKTNIIKNQMLCIYAAHRLGILIYKLRRNFDLHACLWARILEASETIRATI